MTFENVNKYEGLDFDQCLAEFSKSLKNLENCKNNKEKIQIFMTEIYEIFKYMDKMTKESINEIDDDEKEDDEFMTEFREMSFNITNAFVLRQRRGGGAASVPLVTF